MIQEVLVETEELYNFKQLEEIAAGNSDFIKSLAMIFIKTAPVDSAELVLASKAGDWQKVSKYAHKLKSTIDSMNILSIKSDIRTLEIDAKNKINTGNLLVLAEKVDCILSTVASQVREQFEL